MPSGPEPTLVPFPREKCLSRRLHSLEQATGDAGWAGVLAEAFLADPRRLVYVIHDPGDDLLPLFAEAQGLLPAQRRWDLTFSTYFTSLPQGQSCVWRGVVRGSPEALQASRLSQSLILDLASPLGMAEGGSARRAGP